MGANVGTPGQYFMSVTAHGVSMAYVLTTFFIMGFGYFVAVTALNRPLPGKAVGLGRVTGSRSLGVVVTIIPIALGQASVLFTFYPPLTASVVVLHRAGAGRGRLVGLVRPDARRDAGMEARKSRAGPFRSRCLRPSPMR